MHSDKSSTSVKRAVSEAPALSATGTCQNTQADQMSTLSLADQHQDIDAYMASQGEDSIPATIDLAAVILAEKLAFVEKAKKKRLEIGETWFLVSKDWWKRWRKACTGEEDKEGIITEQELGPVDNRPLVDPEGNLRIGLVDGEDVEFVPPDVWRGFVSWCVNSVILKVFC